MKFTPLQNIGVIFHALPWGWILIIRMNGFLSLTIISNAVAMESWI
jgi:hypothetical protein